MSQQEMSATQRAYALEIANRELTRRVNVLEEDKSALAGMAAAGVVSQSDLADRLAAAEAERDKLREVAREAWHLLPRYVSPDLWDGYCTATYDRLTAALAPPADAGQPAEPEPGDGAVGYPEACRYCGYVGMWIETMPPKCSKCGKPDTPAEPGEGGK